MLDGLNIAWTQRRPVEPGQCTSIAFALRCRETGITPSMARLTMPTTMPWRRAFFADLECDLLARRRFQSQAEGRMAAFEWIEGWYNPHRRHSALGYLSPINFERRILRRQAA